MMRSATLPVVGVCRYFSTNMTHTTAGPPLDSLLARRCLQGVMGLVRSANATGTLDLEALARLLPSAGLGDQPADWRALMERLDVRGVRSLTHLPWPGPPRRVGDALLLYGDAALYDGALRLAAAHALGNAPERVAFSGPSPGGVGTQSMELFAARDTGGPVFLAVGDPSVTVDLVSPAARDLQPVLKVLAERSGTAQPAPSDETGYALLSVLQAQEPALRDERAANDERAGIYTTAGAAIIDLSLVDADAADERVASRLKNAEGWLWCVEPALVEWALAVMADRLRAAWVLAPAQMHPGVTSEIPDVLVDAATGHVVTGLLQGGALNPRDVVLNGNMKVGETAVSTPCALMAGLARRVCCQAQAAAVDLAAADALLMLSQARQSGRLTGSVRVSLAAHVQNDMASARALAVAFIQAQVGGGNRAQPARKVRIRG
jgi:hypothetical protein